MCKAKQPFERLVLTKAEALRLFADNPFKVALITAKIPDDGGCARAPTLSAPLPRGALTPAPPAHRLHDRVPVRASY